ncbi:MAG TPA: phosphatase PAP2 family protein [Planctomycetota bacterium]|nr:phosphatase PAP2 family protein [Planctomycetota bacterium]
MLERFQALDIEVFRVVHQTLWRTLFAPILVLLVHTGEGWEITGAVLASLLVAPVGRRVRVLLDLVAPVLVASLASYGLKFSVRAERPLTLVPSLVLNPDMTLRHHSWPSGHVCAAFAFAVSVLMLALSRPPWTRTWTVLVALAFGHACLVALARVAVGAHWPSDVLAGAILGSCVAWITCRAMEEWRQSRHCSQSRWNRLS